MPLSTTVRNEMLQDMVTRHATMYLALSTDDPGSDGSGMAEPSGGYIRQLAEVTVSGAQIVLDTAVSFPMSASNWGTLAYGALFDDEGAGTFLGGEAITPVACPANTVVTIPEGTVLVDLA